MAPVCPPALSLLTITAAVLALGERVAAGDEGAVAEAEALAALLTR